jgi:pimeloyl-ACP methyl ester carboxylesterase
MLAGHNAPMTEAPRTDGPRVESLPVPGGQIERFRIPGGPGVPVVVVGGIETGLRFMRGTEALLARRWADRARARSVIVVGRPLPDDPDDAGALLHPRAAGVALAVAVADLVAEHGPLAFEAESGGGRISMWLTVDRPELVSRLVLAASASQTPLDSQMAPRMHAWITLAELGEWGELFALQAVQMRPGGLEGSAPPASAFEAAASLRPRPATPERFIAELRGTVDPTSFVTERLGEIAVPTLLLAGAQDNVVPLAATQLVAERVPGARLEVDPECGHTVRTSFRGYDELVEAFLAEGDG